LIRIYIILMTVNFQSHSDECHSEKCSSPKSHSEECRSPKSHSEECHFHNSHSEECHSHKNPFNECHSNESCDAEVFHWHAMSTSMRFIDEARIVSYELGTIMSSNTNVGLGYKCLLMID